MLNKWEYCVIAMDIGIGDDFEEMLNGLGDQGWELVAVTSSDKWPLKAFLKRPQGSEV